MTIPPKAIYSFSVCMRAQLYSTLCDPIDCSPPGSSIQGTFWAILEWVSISFSRRSSWPRDQTHISCVSCIIGQIILCVYSPFTPYRYNAILIKLSMPFFFSTELEQKKFTTCMETQKTSSSQSNLEKESQSWRNQDPWLQTTLQSHHDSMVLAQKQKYRSVKLDRKLKDKPTHLWSPNLCQRRQEYPIERRLSLQ